MLLKGHSPIDILINNVGGRRENIPTEEMPLETWRRLIDLNLTSVFVCTKHLGGAMVKRGWGRVINIASICGQIATRNIHGHIDRPDECTNDPDRQQHRQHQGDRNHHADGVFRAADCALGGFGRLVHLIVQELEHVVDRRRIRLLRQLHVPGQQQLFRLVDLAGSHQLQEAGLLGHVIAALRVDLGKTKLALDRRHLGTELVELVRQCLALLQDVGALLLHLGRIRHDHHVSHRTFHLADVVVHLVERNDLGNADIDQIINAIANLGDRIDRITTQDGDQQRQQAEPEEKPDRDFHIIQIHAVRFLLKFDLTIDELVRPGPSRHWT